MRTRTTKFIFVTGGVMSSLGKGLASASVGALLEARGGRPITISAVSARNRAKDRGVPLDSYDWEDDPVALAVLPPDPTVPLPADLDRTTTYFYDNLRREYQVQYADGTVMSRERMTVLTP